MDSVGQELKKERELRGISLKEIADSTKINIRYLRALEEDKFDMLPGKFFIKSIIKSYAAYIGLEEETILDHFHQTLLLKKEDKEEPIEEEALPTEIPRKFKALFRILGYFIIFIIALIIIVFLIRSQKSVSINEVTQTTELLPYEELPQPIVSSLVPTQRMSLELRFNQKTWLKIFTDGKIYFNGIKYPGDVISVSADNAFLIHIGNAGGFNYHINGLPGKPLGKSGQVIKYLRITYTNYKQYLEDSNEIDTDFDLSNRIN